MTAGQPNGVHASPKYDRARGEFAYFGPKLNNPIFMENAGGSQVPRVVIQGVTDHLTYNNAQLGAGHSVSNRADASMAGAHETIKIFVNAKDQGDVILGGSTSQLMANLSDAYRRSGTVTAGDEVIVHEACHEANAGPWERLARETGATLKIWKIQTSPPFTSHLDDLKVILSPKTKIVAMVHVSNVLGEVNDVAAIQKLVRSAGNAHLVVDGVAYAPHLAIDVSAWAVDWYVFSTYKTYGPYMAALFGRHDALKAVTSGGPNHFFVPLDDPVYKFELGSCSHEGTGGLVALGKYLQFIAGEETSSKKLSRQTVEAAFEQFQAMEAPLQQQLVDYLKQKPGVTIVGPSHAEVGKRVPTISFVMEGRKCGDIASALHSHNVACRNGHMYAYRLLTALVASHPSWDVHDGVVRISMLHYNTPAEVKHVINALETIL